MHDDGRAMVGRGHEAEDACKARADPQPATPVFAQHVNDIVESIFRAVAREATVRPAPVEAVVSADPQRAEAIFEQRADKTLFRVIVQQTDLDRQQLRLSASLRESKQALERPAPDRPIAPFKQRSDETPVAGRVFGHTYR